MVILSAWELTHCIAVSTIYYEPTDLILTNQDAPYSKFYFCDAKFPAMESTPNAIDWRSSNAWFGWNRAFPGLHSSNPLLHRLAWNCKEIAQGSEVYTWMAASRPEHRHNPGTGQSDQSILEMNIGLRKPKLMAAIALSPSITDSLPMIHFVERNLLDIVLRSRVRMSSYRLLLIEPLSHLIWHWPAYKHNAPW